MLCLPDAVLFLIASSLASNDRSAFRKTCKAFRDAFDPTVTELNIYGTDDVLSVLERFGGPRVSSLCAYSGDTAWLRDLERLCPSLVKLKFGYPSEHLDLLSTLTRLKVLHLELDKKFDICRLPSLTALVHLDELKIGIDSYVEFTDGLPIRITPTSLRSLKLEMSEPPLGKSSLLPLSLIECLGRLEELDFDQCFLRDLSPLSSLSHLRTFRSTCYVFEDSFDSLAPLAGLTKLEELDVSFSRVSDLSALSRCKRLQKLVCNYCEDLADISVVSHLGLLLELDVGLTKVSDLSALSGCTMLQTLNADDTNISDITALSRCAQLEHVSIAHTSVSDITALSGCTKLKSLNIMCTSVSDITALSGCTKLRSLYIIGNTSMDPNFPIPNKK